MSGANLTLDPTALAACRPVSGEGGQVLRAFCPFHGSDHQRSLRVTLSTGRFVCFACGAWGYLEEARQRWHETHQRAIKALQRSRRPSFPRQSSPVSSQATSGASRPPVAPPLQPPPADLVACLASFQAALPGSRGEAYLRSRGIPLAIAQKTGIGYAPPGTWPHRRRDWKWGRLVVPHTTPEGDVVNLYGRAVGPLERVPKTLRHDHLPRDKGYFNTSVLRLGTGLVWVCEGAFDALSLLAAGYSRVIAIFGVHGWRWEWVRTVFALTFALDADAVGQQQWRVLARQAALRGKQVAVLPPTAYGQEKDVNAAWVAGTLSLGVGASTGTPDTVPYALHERWEERAAIIECEGGLPRAVAEQAAWQCLGTVSDTDAGLPATWSTER